MEKRTNVMKKKRRDVASYRTRRVSTGEVREKRNDFGGGGENGASFVFTKKGEDNPSDKKHLKND